MRPVTFTPSALVSTPVNLIPQAVVNGVTPSRPRKKSKCHHERRNSPSVAHCRPMSSCFLMPAAISRSSMALRVSAVISPFWRLARASLSAAGRSRLPTWSARNGGEVRGMAFPHGVIASEAKQSPLTCSRAGRGDCFGALRAPRNDRILSPDLFGDLDDHAQLGPLLFLGQSIAVLGRSEAALRRESQLPDVDELRRLLDAALDLVLALEPACL